MPYIYKYIDKRDGITKYVGVVITGNIKERHYNHISQDYWCDDNYILKYFELDTKSEAYAFENHLISYLSTYNYYNIAKSDYGINRFLKVPEDKYWKSIYKSKYGIHEALQRKNGTNVKMVIQYLISLSDNTLFKVKDICLNTGLTSKQIRKITERNKKLRDLFKQMNTGKKGYYIWRSEYIYQ